MPATLEHARETFIAFRVESVWLQSVYDTAHALFHSGDETDAVLNRIAPGFFADLNHIIIEYWVLIVCRLTDPPRTFGRENITAQLLVEQLDQLGLLTDEIRRSSLQLSQYRAVLNDARNRVVSHADKVTFLNPSLLGAHSDRQLVDFVQALQRFNDLVGGALGEGPLDFRSTYGPGDVHDLLRVLRKAS